MKRPLGALSRLRDLRLIDCQDGGSHNGKPFVLESMLRGISFLETFIVEKASYTQPTVDRVLSCLSHLQASLRHLVIAITPGANPPKYAFNPITLRDFRRLQNLALSISFLYWEWLSAYTTFDRLPPNLENLQLQFYDPLNAYCGQHFEFRAITLGKTMENLAEYAHTYCPALQSVWWWCPEKDHYRSLLNELRLDSNAMRIQNDVSQGRSERPATMASKFSDRGIPFAYSDATRLDQTPLLRLIPLCAWCYDSIKRM